MFHRLDLGTSGIIIAAKNDEAHRNLAAQFGARTVTKIYFALVFGSMRTNEGRFDFAIGRSIGDRKKMSGNTKKGRAVFTEWKVLERFDSSLSWLETHLRTGRMHQIRAHFSESAYPLVGDPLYGGNRKALRILNDAIRDAVLNFKRPALYTWRFCIDHPKTAKRLEFRVEMPTDIESL